MEKPKVYASPINKKINNSQEVFYENNTNNKIERNYNRGNVLKKINDIFNSPNHVYKSRVDILTNYDRLTCDIVGKTSNSLLTMDGRLIRITDIKDIKKI